MSAESKTNNQGSPGGHAGLRKPQYLYLLAASLLLMFLLRLAQHGMPSSANEVAKLAGEGIGFALIPLIAMRFAGNAVGWIAFSVIAIGALQAKLQIFG